MQDQQVAFDPISIRTVLPWQTRVFVFYLFIACGIWLVRTIKLFWQLKIFPISSRKLQEPSSKDDQADFLARSALARQSPEFIALRNVETASLLRHAGNKFSYMWDECWIRVSALHRLAGLTYISSIFIFAWNAMTDFTEISRSKTTGMGAIGGGFSQLLAQLTLGMGACVVLYVTGSFFEKALMQRKAMWNYICAKSEVEMNRR